MLEGTWDCISLSFLPNKNKVWYFEISKIFPTLLVPTSLTEPLNLWTFIFYTFITFTFTFLYLFWTFIPLVVGSWLWLVDND